MAAINIIFVILTLFVPFLLFVLVFILPLCSAIISYYCKKRYFPFYVIVVSVICLLIDLPDTIFYVIPSLITGFIFGLLIQVKMQTIFIFLINTFVQFIFSLSFIPLIEVFTNRDIVIDMAKIFSLSDYPYLSYLKYIVIFIVAFAQIIITYIVMYSELKKFHMTFNESKEKAYYVDIVIFSFILLSIIFSFFLPEMSFVFMIASFISAITRITYLDFSYYKIYLLELCGVVFLTIFIMALFYQKVDKPLGLLFFLTAPLLISLCALCNYYLLSKRNKCNINK